MSVLSFLRPQIPGFEPARVGSTMHIYDPYAAFQCAPQTAAANAAWPAANRALYIPFSLSEVRVVRLVGVQNGSPASGNLDVGIYDAVGARLVSSGSTAQAGTNTIQSVDLTDTPLLPGSYFMALAFDGTSSVGRFNPSTQFLRCSGVQEEASAFPLPATFTLANPSTAYMPIMIVGFETAI